MCKLSIIIPVYQVKPYLERCIESVLSQSYTDYEVVLVDDGSTDGSGDICDIYAANYSNVKVIHKTNGGLSSARNIGLSVASGDYLMFLDSDDFLHSKAIEVEIKFLEENHADIVVCPLVRFSNLQDVDAYSPLDNIQFSILSGLEAERRFFNNPRANMFVSSCGKIFRRNLFNGIQFPEGRLFEDEYTTYKLYYLCEKIVVLDTALYYYFVNQAGITQNLDLVKRLDEYDAQNERIIFFNNNGEIELYHLALLEFLRSAQWDLLAFRDKKNRLFRDSGKLLQEQYRHALVQAEKEKIISFPKNIDYYVLAFPRKKTFFRLKRKVFLGFRKT